MTAGPLPILPVQAASPSWSQVPPTLTTILRTDFGTLLAPLQPEIVFLYGSFIKGTADRHSDVDLAIRFDEPDVLARRRALAWATLMLQQTWQTARIQIGDLDRPESAPYLVHVVTQGICVYARTPEARWDFEDGVLRLAAEAPTAQALTWQALKARYREELTADVSLVERDKVERLLQQSLEMLRALLPYRTMPAERFHSRSEFEHRYAAGHILRILLECTLALARHLILSCGWGRMFLPKDLFGVLTYRRVLPADLADRLALVALLKEPLTYPGNGDVDWVLVRHVIQTQLADFTAFGRCLIGYLTERGL